MLIITKQVQNWKYTYKKNMIKGIIGGTQNTISIQQTKITIKNTGRDEQFTLIFK